MKIDIEISEELHERLVSHAKRNGTTVESIVDAALAPPHHSGV